MAKRRAYSDEALGPTIERLMAETGLTYRALADKTGLSAGYLNHIVHGNRPVPSNDVLARLAGAFGVSPSTSASTGSASSPTGSRRCPSSSTGSTSSSAERGPADAVDRMRVVFRLIGREAGRSSSCTGSVSRVVLRATRSRPFARRTRPRSRPPRHGAQRASSEAAHHPGAGGRAGGAARARRTR